MTQPLQKQIFEKMVEGKTHKTIAEELGVTSCHVIKIKKETIWPIVKEVMNIPEDMYDVLCDSGRIYSA